MNIRKVHLHSTNCWVFVLISINATPFLTQVSSIHHSSAPNSPWLSSGQMPLTWSVLGVNVTGPFGQKLFWVCMRTSLDEINIWIGRLRKEDWPSQQGWASFGQSKMWVDHKGWVGGNFAGLAAVWGGRGLLLAWVFKAAALLGLQLADLRSRDSAASTATWAGSL